MSEHCAIQREFPCPFDSVIGTIFEGNSLAVIKSATAISMPTIAHLSTLEVKMADINLYSFGLVFLAAPKSM